MFVIPSFIVALWLGGLLGVGLLAGGGYLLYEWSRRSWDAVIDATGHVEGYVFDPDWGLNAETAFFAAGLALLAWALLGGLVRRLIGRLLHGASGMADDPGHRPVGETTRLRRADGTELNVELVGPVGAPTIVLTHGWGTNSAEWNYLKRELGGRCRLIAWDLPGLGASSRPPDRDYGLENLARMLDEVITLAGDRPVILAGHSIGGMIALTYCKRFPEALGTRVTGLALVQTTYTNPVRTTRNAPLYTALERPVLVPLLHLTIALWPLAWLMSWLGYLNGSAHGSTRRSGFAGTQRPGQVEFVARFQPKAPPDVVARGMFGMLAYDATAALSTIAVPTLVVPGDQDPVCIPEASAKMAREIPGARLEPLAPGKHMALIEHHARFAELLGELAASGNTTVSAGSPSVG
jgi:pimeloyl-ACP methyl ester carboxylesterase